MYLEENDNKVREIVQRFLRTSHMSQFELAKKAEIDRSHLNAMLNGHRKFSKQTIFDLSKVIKSLKEYCDC